ncbi:MAG TPA: lasso peptide biosynthesis B2 protein [Pseudomonadales bacterium]|nr:lasso peptide biosynthesis B2 protein [Pseudomonadales bacterium]
MLIRTRLTTHRLPSLRTGFGCLLILCLLGVSRLLVLIMPARLYCQLFGRDLGVVPFSLLLSAQQKSRARRIGYLITRVAAYTPWRSLCLEQALCAQFFLRYYGIPAVTFFGVARDPAAGLKAHAWVCAGPVMVTGGQSFNQFTIVRTLLRPAQLRESVIQANAATAAR